MEQMEQWAAVPRGNERGTRSAIEPMLRLWDASPQIPDEWLAYILAVYEYAIAVPRRELGCLSEKCLLQGCRAKLGDYLNRWQQCTTAPDPRYYQRGFITGADMYEKVAKVTGIPLYENPDLMLLPEVSARAFFAWMTDPRLAPEGGLAKYTSDAGFDFAQAFKLHEGLLRMRNSFDMTAVFGEYALTRVTSSYRLFLDCIEAAKVPESARTTLGRTNQER